MMEKTNQILLSSSFGVIGLILGIFIGCFITCLSFEKKIQEANKPNTYLPLTYFNKSKILSKRLKTEKRIKELEKQIKEQELLLDKYEVLLKNSQDLNDFYYKILIK